MPAWASLVSIVSGIAVALALQNVAAAIRKRHPRKSRIPDFDEFSQERGISRIEVTKR